MRKKVGGKAIVWNEDPFRVLISTVLSQRTKDRNTAKASEALFARYDTPEKLAEASTEEVENLIRPAGFYRVKAARIQRISRDLIERFDGKVPRDREKMMSLEGVGPKTSGCVQVYGFDDDALPVDTHVHRISNRLGLVKTRTPEETEPALKKAVPKKYWKEINLLMVRYGQQVCFPRNPNCRECGLRKVCEYNKPL
ncbi:MAG: endonuclease III [Candidatus Aenigmarchaeota archaeon]|nr:endonuclease III [Candidatus Aenigmarchaeota archaeon]